MSDNVSSTFQLQAPELIELPSDIDDSIGTQLEAQIPQTPLGLNELLSNVDDSIGTQLEAQISQTPPGFTELLSDVDNSIGTQLEAQIPQTPPQLEENQPSTSILRAPIHQTSHCAIELTKIKRERVQTLRRLDILCKDIVEILGHTYAQVYYACHYKATPQKHKCGRHPKLGEAQRQQLILWLKASKDNAKARWSDIPSLLDLGISYSGSSIATVLKLLNIFRRISRVRPQLSAENCRARRGFADVVINQTNEDQEKVLWSDETVIRSDI